MSQTGVGDAVLSRRAGHQLSLEQVAKAASEAVLDRAVAAEAGSPLQVVAPSLQQIARARRALLANEGQDLEEPLAFIDEELSRAACRADKLASEVAEH